MRQDPTTKPSQVIDLPKIEQMIDKNPAGTRRLLDDIAARTVRRLIVLPAIALAAAAGIGVSSPAPAQAAPVPVTPISAGPVAYPAVRATITGPTVRIAFRVRGDAAQAWIQTTSQPARMSVTRGTASITLPATRVRVGESVAEVATRDWSVSRVRITVTRASRVALDRPVGDLGGVVVTGTATHYDVRTRQYAGDQQSQIRFTATTLDGRVVRVDGNTSRAGVATATLPLTPGRWTVTATRLPGATVTGASSTPRTVTVGYWVAGKSGARP